MSSRNRPDPIKINTARLHALRCSLGLITEGELRDELRKLDWHPDDDPALRGRGKGKRRKP
jgi:hypothetical protein